MSDITQKTAHRELRATWLSRKPLHDSGLTAALATLVLMSFSLLEWMNIGNLSHWMPASFNSVYGEGELWRAWSTIFVHADLGHLVSNSFLLFILGFFLYGYFGHRLFPWSALLWGGLTNLIVLRTYAPSTALIGASGVVYWMGGAWLVLYFFLSRQKNLWQRWIRTFGVALLLFMPAEAFEPKVSYRTHFVGFCLGLLAGAWHYWRYREKFKAAEVHEWLYDELEDETLAIETPSAAMPEATEDRKE